MSQARTRRTVQLPPGAADLEVRFTVPAKVRAHLDRWHAVHARKDAEGRLAETLEETMCRHTCAAAIMLVRAEAVDAERMEAENRKVLEAHRLNQEAADLAKELELEP